MAENNKKEKRSFAKFGLGNFKSFRGIQEIELAPITLVFGQNSGGKTSLLQSILSLSQSFYEIEKGKFELSGTKVDSGTFETVLNNQSDKKEIIIENKNNLRFDRLPPGYEDAYFIDTFKALHNSKIRFYIKSVEGLAYNYISKLEILFSDYLEGHKLIFNRSQVLVKDESERYVTEYYDDLFENTRGLKSSYELNDESFDNLKEINKKCFEEICNSFRTMVDAKKKGLWYSKTLKQYRVSFGPTLLPTRRTRNSDRQIIALIRYAAISSGLLIMEDRGRIRTSTIILKEFKTFKKTKISNNVFDILKELSKEIFKFSLEIYDKKEFNLNLNVSLNRTPKFERFKTVLDSSTTNDRLIGNTSFFSTYSSLRNSFNEKSLFSKIEALKDNYLEELSKVDEQNSQLNEKILNNYLFIKHKFRKLNSDISRCEEVFLSILKQIKGDHSTVNNRQIIRDYLIQFPFYEIDNLDKIELLTIKDALEEINGKVNSRDNLTGRQFESKCELELLIPLINRIKSLREEYKSNYEKTKKFRVDLAKDYNSRKDFDLKYLKTQFRNIINLGYQFRRQTISFEVSLKNRIILFLLENKILNSSVKRDLIYQNFAWIISSGTEEDFEFFDADEIETIDNSLYKFIDERFPNIFWFEIDDLLPKVSFIDTSRHLLPSAITRQEIIAPRFNNELIHLGPSRPGAKRFYTVSDVENATPDDVCFFLKLYKDNNQLSINNLNKYLESLEILNSISQDKSKDKRYDFESILVSRSKNETPVNLADTGYGLSQLFPIIINAVIKKVNTILVQQPETHLHPRLQAEVGSILVDSISGFEESIEKDFARKFWLVETHSEIMLLRILKRIRNGEFDPNFLRVYYVDQSTKEGSIIKRMHISDEGDLITQWPKGFFSNDIDEIFDF